MDSVTNRSSKVELLLKTHEALLLAKSEQEILSAVALTADSGCTLRLIYLERGHCLGESIDVVATWHRDQIWEDDPVAKVSGPDVVLNHLIHEAEKLAESIWFLPDLTSVFAFPMTTFSKGVRGFAFVKLYRDIPHCGYQWDSAICMTWDTAHCFADEERYMLTVVSQTAAAVVANRKLYQQTVANLAKLTELDKVKTQFLYTISHELRTPLTGIITIADTLLHTAGNTLTGEAVDDVRWILDSGKHLLSVINDILDLAKIEAGQMALVFEPIDIATVVDDVLHYVKPLATQKRLHLAHDVRDSIIVLADRKRLYQVLLNLLSNAIKFSDAGTIRMSASLEGDTVILSVKDPGIGIHPAHQAIIFEPFQQVNSALSRHVGGTGLGLPICRRLVELHGGSIWVSSEPGHGSTFFVALPVKGEAQ